MFVVVRSMFASFVHLLFNNTFADVRALFALFTAVVQVVVGFVLV